MKFNIMNGDELVTTVHASSAKRALETLDDERSQPRGTAKSRGIKAVRAGIIAERSDLGYTPSVPGDRQAESSHGTTSIEEGAAVVSDRDKRFTANGEAAFLVSVAMQRSNELTTFPGVKTERIEDGGLRARVFVPELASYPDAVRKRVQDTVNSYIYRHLRIEIEAKEA